ncbi:hypothetical protein PC118_g19722 [Phytophthora cactorum]|uniref:Uncharacterized protein n=1 Tax=Phytophthora cactorum TaxID=29920 RepID=A0A8T0YJC2_9STRA|nr:hypothetical protein PC113_g19944 [Phytophthora cactorum]KAG2881891.1 hypothetical protein PC117_g26316 [Phytophthora cactorum]KAG2965480.1 hypothetical protein PC118_g19722 [Phytophthora cactorum]
MRLYQHPLLRIQVLKSTVIKRRLRRGSTCRGQDVNQDRSSNSALTRWKPYHTRHLRDHNPDHRGSSVASVEVTVVTKLGGGFRR